MKNKRLDGAADSDPEIIHEDDIVLIVNKPAGLPVHRLESSTQKTLADWLLYRHPQLGCVGKPGEAGIVHRLDNTTSGCVVVARNQDVYDYLRKIWNTDAVEKTYTALVLGKTDVKGVIVVPIAHHPRKKKKMMVCETGEKAVCSKGRPAVTRFRKRESYVLERNDYSLLDVEITTGVRHQIRVHLASIGHPLAGDLLYQNPSKRKLDGLGLARPFLHLKKIELHHPETRQPVCVECSLPENLSGLLQRL